jgi:hypothetical protein
MLIRKRNLAWGIPPFCAEEIGDIVGLWIVVIFSKRERGAKGKGNNVIDF